MRSLVARGLVLSDQYDAEIKIRLVRKRGQTIQSLEGCIRIVVFILRATRSRERTLRREERRMTGMEAVAVER